MKSYKRHFYRAKVTFAGKLFLFCFVFSFFFFFHKHTSTKVELLCKGGVTLGNVSCNLSRNFVAPPPPPHCQLHGKLTSATSPQRTFLTLFSLPQPLRKESLQDSLPSVTQLLAILSTTKLLSAACLFVNSCLITFHTSNCCCQLKTL